MITHLYSRCYTGHTVRWPPICWRHTLQPNLTLTLLIPSQELAFREKCLNRSPSPSAQTSAPHFFGFLQECFNGGGRWLPFLGGCVPIWKLFSSWRHWNAVQMSRKWPPSVAKAKRLTDASKPELIQSSAARSLDATLWWKHILKTWWAR